MHIDARTDDLGFLQEDFDLCIVGAGPAGITIAEAFKGTGYKVCVVESGGFEEDASVQALAEGGVSAPSNEVEENYLSLHSQRRFGGTGSLWGGFCREMDALDFEQRNLPGDHGWPITKEDLAAFYPRNLVDGKQPDRKLEGCDLHLKYFERSLYPFHLIHAETFARDKNIQILTYATVVDLPVEIDSAKVKAITIATLDGQRHSIRARQVVLACGGAGTVKLLLNARSTFSEGLGNQHGNVGRYFMEHPHFQFYKPPGMLWLAQDLADQIYRDKRYKPCLTLSDEVIREKGLLNFALLLSAPIKENSKWAGAKWYQPNFAALLDQGSGQSSEQGGEFFTLSFRAEQQPNKDSRISLSNEKDHLGLQKVHLDWRVTDFDSQSLFTSLDEMIRELGVSAKGRMRLVIDREAPWETMVGGGHLMGTTRMSASPEDGVVDANCRVHGIENLFIAGSSVFASGGFANPTATILALAARLGGYLKQTL